MTHVTPSAYSPDTTEPSTIRATQESCLLGALINHCGKPLTPELVDTLFVELLAAMRSGCMAWAFRHPIQPAP